MERYASFEQLKEQTASGTSNSSVLEATEKQLVNFIDLLRTSVVPANNSAEPINTSNIKVNFTENAR